MRSVFGDPSVMLWMAAACIAFLGARTFVEYLRRLHYDGPVRLWRELLLGAAAIAVGVWAAMIIDISAQGLAFDIGYHPVKLFGSLLGVFVAVVLLMAWTTFRPSGLQQLATMVLVTLLTLLLQVAVIWSVGAEPGLKWRVEPMVFALLVILTGFGVSGRMVMGARRGSSGDRGSRRLMAALVLGACLVAAQELVLTGSGLDRQVVSGYARMLPEVIVTLLAGAAVPIGLVLLLVDQRSQQRARAADRVRRKRRHSDSAIESMFSESLLAGAADPQQPPKP
ncbi:MAG: hypothetical protein IPI03_13195 [Rubrivivax sp.]|nr:hypothetical protein [Rubrivivax sp.]